MPPIRDSRVFLLALLAVAASVGLAYSNVLHAPFVFDDLYSIVRNPKIRDVSKFLTLEKLFAPRPLVDLTFALNHSFGGLEVFGYHLVNLVVHIVNGLLVFGLSLSIFRKVGPYARHGVSRAFKFGYVTLQAEQAMALFAALIFVLHPIQTQGVTYIVQRYTSMAAMFYLGAVLSYVKARTLQVGRSQSAAASCSDDGAARDEPIGLFRGKVFPGGLFALTGLLGVLAFLCKQNAATLPGAILLVELVLFDRSWVGWKRKLLVLIPCCGLFVIFVFFSGVFRGGMDFGALLDDLSARTRDTESVTRWEYLMTQFNVLVVYLRMLLLPVGQSLDHMVPMVHSFWSGTTPWALLFLVLLLAGSLASLKKRPLITLAVLWFFVTLSVESSIFPIRDAMVEHRLYLPMFGFALIVPSAMLTLLRWKWLPAGLVLVAAIGLAGSGTYARNQVWQSEVRLWSDVLSKSQHNDRAWYNLGNAHKEQQNFQAAIEAYAHAVQLRENYTKAWYNWGNVYYEQKLYSQAISKYKKALHYNPKYTKALMNLGLCLVHEHKNRKALSIFNGLLRKNPKNAKIYYNLGVLNERLAKKDLAFSNYSRAIELNDQQPEAHYNLANLLVQEGRYEEAEKHYRQAIAIKKDYLEAHFNLANLYLQQKKSKSAFGHYQHALSINPDFDRGHFMLGYVLWQRGQLRQAAEAFHRAGQLTPEFVKAHVYEGKVQLQRGAYELAIEAFLRASDLRPDMLGIRFSLGRTYMQTQQYSKALAQFDHILKLDPDNKEAAQMLKSAQNRLAGGKEKPSKN